MATGPSTKRSHRLNIRIHEDMLERLTSIAEGMAIPPATLASFAVSEFVERKERERDQYKLSARYLSHGIEKAFTAKIESMNLEDLAKEMGSE